MPARPLFVGVDVQHGSTQLIALDADGHVALRTYLPRADEAEVAPCVAQLLQTLARAHGRAPLVVHVEGCHAARFVEDHVAEHVAATVHLVRREPGAPPVDVLAQDTVFGLYRDAWRCAVLAALGRDDGDDR